MNSMETIIEQLGFSKGEAKTYLTLLRLGTATASELSQKAGIHRISMYDILKRLQEKKAVTYVMLGKNKSYQAAEPKQFLEEIEEKKQEFEEILPQLEAQKATAADLQDATLFKDKNAIKSLIRSMTETKTPLLLLASGWGLKETFPDYYQQWHAQLEKNKVQVRVLLSNKFRETKQPKVYNLRFIPSEFVFPSATAIYDNKVAIITWSNYPTGILLTGKKVSDSYRKYFEVLWKIAKGKK